MSWFFASLILWLGVVAMFLKHVGDLAQRFQDIQDRLRSIREELHYVDRDLRLHRSQAGDFAGAEAKDAEVLKASIGEAHP